MKLFFWIFLVLTSCCSTYNGKEVLGADEFVLDSYKIKEGKYSILEMEGIVFDKLNPSLLEEYIDTVSNDDILYIMVYHPSRKDLTEPIHKISTEIGFKVTDGNIYLPDLPPIKIVGLTLKEATEKIEHTYLQEISNITVFVKYKDRIAKKVELSGMVSLPNILVDGKIRLFDVLSMAKIPPSANLFKSYIAREGKIIPVDMDKLIKSGDLSQNIVMRGGDKIYIAEPSAATIMVMGEVREEKVIDLPSGSMSLRQALAMAHGIPFSGDSSYIQVIRGNIACPKIYLLSWEHVINLPNSSLLLMAGDIVYVASTPITEWNRFISQLLPSFTGLEVARKGVVGTGVLIP